MQASIRNIRRVRTADLDIGPGVTLVAGENDNGKSSTLGAVAAAVTGSQIMPDLLRKEMAQLVHDGAESGLVEVRAPDGSVRVALPEGAVSSTGNPPRATAFAAGLTSLVDMSQTERAAQLIGVLKATPKRDAIFRALREIPLSENAAARLMRDDGAKHSAIAEKLRADGIEMDQFGTVLSEIVQGWDEAHARLVEANKKAKGAWEQITKAKRYGSVIAAGWLPPGWDARMDLVTIEQAEQRVTEAKERHAAALRNAGASDAERQAKQSLADAYDARHNAHEEAVQAYAAADRRVAGCRQALDALPVPTDAHNALSCPHCSKPVRVGSNLHGQILEKADVALPQSEIKDRRDKRAAASGDLSKAQIDAGTADRALAGAKLALQAAADAKEWLAKNPVKASQTDGSFAATTADDVTKAELGLALLRQRSEATAKHREIEKNERLLAILDPKGLRRDALDECLMMFNRTHLAPIAEISGWKPVQIMEDESGLGIYYGGRPYRHLGQSAQYRVRVTLQVALAQIDGSDLLIIDGADILTPGAADGRGALFRLLKAQGIPSLVGMTLGPKDTVPDLAAAGYGRSYVVRDGVVSPIEKQEKSA
jgi:hypothetical protein